MDAVGSCLEKQVSRTSTMPVPGLLGRSGRKGGPNLWCAVEAARLTGETGICTGMCTRW